MELTYCAASAEDIEAVYALCEQLILRYEQPEVTDIPGVLRWVRKKLERAIGQYTVIYADGQKAGYYHFFQNADGQYELDDLYIFDGFQSRGIGSRVIEKCCASVPHPVFLYVFRENRRAVCLYQRLGFSVTQTIGSTRYLMKREHTPSPLRQPFG